MFSAPLGENAWTELGAVLMTSNVQAEAKVPCIPQSESVGLCRGKRRRVSPARVEVNSRFVAPNSRRRRRR
jgi:hypothetical protein